MCKPVPNCREPLIVWYCWAYNNHCGMPLSTRVKPCSESNSVKGGFSNGPAR